MKTLHICNVNFEWELETHSSTEIKESFMIHPNFLQLQFLPFLYANKGDGVVVTHLPSEIPNHLNVHLFEDKIEGYDRIETWGWSEAIEKWTDLPYSVPKHLSEMASRTFSFTHSPKLPGAQLLRHPQEVTEWLKKGPYPKVVKKCFGIAGQRRWILQKPEDLPKKAFQEFDNGHALIAEPWMQRDLDFSTQWMITDKITYLGSTVLENTESGVYRKTYIERDIPFLDNHKSQAQIPLRRLLEMGFQGNVGIDSMIYDGNLHPIVEINLRKTMGWLALQLGKSVAYETGSEGLLPKFLDIGKEITFQKQLKLL